MQIRKLPSWELKRQWIRSVKAKQVLKKYNIPAKNVEIQEIENDKDCNEIQDYMRHIGGGDETQAADQSGKLQQGMLESAGAL